jgi:hypothetical protein
MQGLSYYLRREGLEMRSRFGLRAILIHLLVIAVFGVALPWMRGIEFLDPVMTAAYACLGLLFSAPAVAQGFALARPSSMTEAMVRIAIAVTYGEAMAITILLLGFATVYATNRFAPPPDVLSLAEACALGITASVALTSIAAWITLQFSAGIARNTMRVLFLLLLYLFFLKARWLPDIAIQGSIMCVGVAILAIFAIRRQLVS